MKTRAAIARGEFSGWLRPRSAKTIASAPRWKVGSSLVLAVGAESEAWDGPAAQASIFALSGLSTGPWEEDGFLARKSHLVYDHARPDLKSSYKFPIARVIDGALTVVPAGLAQAARDLAACSLPNDVKAKALRVLDHYREKAEARAIEART